MVFQSHLYYRPYRFRLRNQDNKRYKTFDLQFFIFLAFFVLLLVYLCCAYFLYNYLYPKKKHRSQSNRPPHYYLLLKPIVGMKTQICESLSFIYMVIRLIHQIDKAKRMISKLFGHCICLITEGQTLMKISTPACINSNTTKVIDYDTFFHFVLEKKVLLYSLLLLATSLTRQIRLKPRLFQLMYHA